MDEMFDFIEDIYDDDYARLWFDIGVIGDEEPDLAPAEDVL